MKLILVRHGKPDFPTEEQYYLGRTDLPLCEEGRAQARAARASLPAPLPEVVYCSPLLRCRQTAGILLEGSSSRVEYVDGFMEIDMGDWDGLTHGEIKKRYPGEYRLRGGDMANYRAPGGESFAQVQKRALATLEGLPKTDVMMIVAHWGVISGLLCHFTGRPLSDILFYRDLAYASVNEIEI